MLYSYEFLGSINVSSLTQKLPVHTRPYNITSTKNKMDIVKNIYLQFRFQVFTNRIVVKICMDKITHKSYIKKTLPLFPLNRPPNITLQTFHAI